MKRRIILFLTLLSACTAGFPQNTPLDATAVARLKKGVEEASLRTTTITADFIQEKEMSILDEKIKSTGRFYFKKEKLLRWEYNKPYTYVIVVNNERITIRDENKTSSFDSRANKVFAEINRIIVGGIRGTLLKDEQNFRISYSGNGVAWIVELQPLYPGLKGTLKNITLYFDKKDFSVNRMDMTENSGDKTTITFSDMRLNEPVADEKFILH